MPVQIFMNQIHLSFFVPAKLTKPLLAALRRSVHGARLQAQIRRAVRQLLDRSPVLRYVRLIVSA